MTSATKRGDKQEQPAEQVVESLRRLRQEFESKFFKTPADFEILYKLNSCLYSKYPHHD